MSDTAQELMVGISREIIDPLIMLMFAVAVAYFIYGVAIFIAKADDETERAKGKQHIFWSIIGLVIMVAVYGILALITGTIGADPVSSP